jgi:hypothetical protein
MPPTLRSSVAALVIVRSLALVVSGRDGQSPWLWLIIIGGGIVLYLVDRITGAPRQTR